MHQMKSENLRGRPCKDPRGFSTDLLLMGVLFTPDGLQGGTVGDLTTNPFSPRLFIPLTPNFCVFFKSLLL